MLDGLLEEASRLLRRTKGGEKMGHLNVGSRLFVSYFCHGCYVDSTRIEDADNG